MTDPFQSFALRIILIAATNEYVYYALNTCQWIFDFMGQARRKLTHKRQLCGALQFGGLLQNLLFRYFALRNVMPDGDVLVGLAFRIEKRNDSRIDPINTPIAGTIAKFPLPNLTAGNRYPQIAYEIFWVKTGIDNAVVLAQQLLTWVFRDTAKLIIDESNDSALVGNRYNCGLIKGKLYVRKFLERTLKSGAIGNIDLVGFFQRMIIELSFPEAQWSLPSPDTAAPISSNFFMR